MTSFIIILFLLSHLIFSALSEMTGTTDSSALENVPEF